MAPLRFRAPESAILLAAGRTLCYTPRFYTLNTRAGKGENVSTKVLRVGILGQGRSGYDIHFRWLREAKDKFLVAAVADLMPERVKEAQAELGARAYGNYRELLADRSLKLDLVVNALPSFLHPKGTIEALKAGYHVICEKPAAKSVKDFDRMVEAARQNKRLYLPFQNSRFYPYFEKILAVLASGKLGKIVHISSNWSGFGRRWDWQTIQEYWGGNLLNTGPHPMDHAVLLFGDRMPNVFARLVSENPFGDADNFARVTLYGKDAPVIDILVSSFQAYPQGDQYSIGGTLGGLAGGPGGLKWKYFDEAKAPKRVFRGEWSDNRQYCRESLEWTEENWTPPPSPLSSFQQISKGFYDNAYDVVVNGGKRIITIEQVRRQIAIFEECLRQNRLPRMKPRFLTH
jgi:scyllo-inositol 2-dehydrogenase (NADP+)